MCAREKKKEREREREKCVCGCERDIKGKMCVREKEIVSR